MEKVRPDRWKRSPMEKVTDGKGQTRPMEKVTAAGPSLVRA